MSDITDTHETHETHETHKKSPSAPKAAAAKPAKASASPQNLSLDYAQILIPALILTAICATATLLLALTNLLTESRIAENAAAKAAASRKTVLEAADYVRLDDEGLVYEARNADGQRIGVVVTTTAKGYGGTIEVMTGIGSDGRVAGVTILSMSETPGLGAKTNDSDFLSQYLGASDPDLAVNKDGGTIAAVSGATISSRAVTEAVNSAVAISAGYLDASTNEAGRSDIFG